MFEHNAVSDEFRRINQEYNHVWLSEHSISIQCENGRSRSNLYEGCYPHMVCWLQNIDRLNRALSNLIALSQSHLIDAGCGCGAAALYNSENWDWQGVEGFDIDPDLVILAKQNASAMNAEGRVFFEHCDAKNWERFIGAENLIFQLFNPFSANIILTLVKNAQRTNPASDIYISYINDHHLAELLDAGDLLFRDEIYNLSIVKFSKTIG